MGDAFYTRHLAARAAKLTTVDRSGHPRDLLTAPQAAKVLGYKATAACPTNCCTTLTRPKSYPAAGCAATGTGGALALIDNVRQSYRPRRLAPHRT
jgi:hypothetical protein